MTGNINYTEPLEIRWKLDGLNEVRKLTVGNSIHGPYVSIKNEEWWVTMCFYKGGDNFQVHSTISKNFEANIILERNRVKVRFEKKNGDCLLCSDAYCEENGTFTCSISYNQFKVKVIDRLSDREQLVIVFCFNPKGSTSENVNVPGNKLQDVSSQTMIFDSIETLSKDFKDLLASGDHADVKIKVGCREFKAHKTILAARSSVLSRMFSNDMLENNSGTVTISDCDEDAFEGFLTFLYSGRIDQVDSSKVAELYGIADMYDLQELKKECSKRLILEMSVVSVCNTLRVASLNQEEEMLNMAIDFFINNAEDVLKTVEWETFLKENVKFGNELFLKYVQGIQNKSI